MTWGKSGHLCEPQFPHPHSGDIMASTSQKGFPVEIGRSQLPTFPACEDQVQAGRKKQSSAAHRAEGGPCHQTPGAPVLLYDTVRCDFGQGAHPLPVSTSSPAKWVNDRTSTRKVPEKTEEPLPGASSVQVAPSIAAVSFQVSAIDPVTCAPVQDGTLLPAPSLSSQRA